MTKPTQVKTFDDVRALVNSYFIVRDFLSWRAMTNDASFHPSVTHVFEILAAHALYDPKDPSDYGKVVLRANEKPGAWSEEFDDRLTQKYLRKRTGLGTSAVSNALAELEKYGRIERRKRNGLPDVISVEPFCWKVADWIVSGRTEG
jgi:hypothetical protein